MIFKDYYKILGLEDNKVTPEEIKTAYRLKVNLNTSYVKVQHDAHKIPAYNIPFKYISC